MGAMTGDISQEAGTEGVADASAAGGVEPTSGAGAEPVAEPTAESVAEAPVYALPDEWDGDPEGLEGDARGWFDAFNQNYFSSRQVEHERQLKAKEAEAERYKNWYNTVASNRGVDPEKQAALAQVQELTASMETLQAEYDSFKQEVEAVAQAEANEYFDLVKDMFADELSRVDSDPQLKALISDAIDHVHLHKALDLVRRDATDVLDVVVSMVKNGTDEEKAWQAAGKVLAMRTPAAVQAAKPPEAKPRPAATLVAGAQPEATQRIPTGPRSVLDLPEGDSRTSWAIREAMREKAAR